MRRVYGIRNLISYLDSVGVRLTEEQIVDLIQKRDIPHLRPAKTMYVFNLDHIDWWLGQKGLKP